MRPAVDVLFRSAAVAMGPRVIGVVLSGMLDDGTAGLWAIKSMKGMALVQDPDEALYPSMPDSALQHVAVDFVGPATALASEIVRLTGEAAAPAPREDAVEASQRQRLETLIANEGNALQHGVMNLGKVSQYTCPDCHGVLVEIEEGAIVRFRCHTGHAFSIKTLLAEIDGAIDHGLWDTIRAAEERVLLLRQLCSLEQNGGSQDALARREQQITDAEKSIEVLKRLVLSPSLLGHGVDS